MRLKPTERITAIWVIYYKEIFDYPYLGVQSSEGRFYTLAPEMLEIKLVADASEGALLGLYFDDSPCKPIRMHSFGIFSADTKPKEKQSQPETSDLKFRVTPDSHYSSIFYKLMGCMWSQFSSQAIFENVSYLETCSVGVRCMGMILTYFDGHQKVLGQWYEHHPSISAVIHNLEPIPGQGLRFFISYAEEYGLSYLERVELRPLKRGNVVNDATDQTMVEVNYAVCPQASDYALLS
ncbi:uncharacterized protein N7483_002151 [Penicillium malachiteum]|uniref:uncharacterized protein n=1 Tax=Penicillium malachiteum TaxID=1324776 RepID=UPI0025499FDC|nr:uncharacterized protein N7483_002151 [Penicillium malachiteum]KAJ5737026.1 hypothetical protein N7483_002151 [Penicillium malachiteum]